MNVHETQQLCRLVACFCPSQKFDQHSPAAWALVLSKVSFDDAQEAVTNLAGLPLEPGKARYIEPGHIIAQVRSIRDKRLSASTTAEPPPDVADDTEAYLTWLRASRANAANRREIA